MSLKALKTDIQRLSLADQRRLLAWLRRQVDAADAHLAAESVDSEADWQPPGTEQAEAIRRLGQSCFLLQRVKCGKANCKCAAGKLHGPYWYEFWREGNRVRKRYHGKRIRSPRS